MLAAAFEAHPPPHNTAWKVASRHSLASTNALHRLSVVLDITLVLLVARRASESSVPSVFLHLAAVIVAHRCVAAAANLLVAPKAVATWLVPVVV